MAGFLLRASLPIFWTLITFLVYIHKVEGLRYPLVEQKLFALEPPFADGFNPDNFSSPYFYFQKPDGPAKDGATSVTSTAIRVSANPFTASMPPSPLGTLEHVKFLALLKTAYNSSGSTKVVHTLNAAGAVYKPEANPFPKRYVKDPLDDPRLGSFGFINLDPTTFMVADFLLTNRGVWAIYERLPFGTGVYKSFTQVKRVSSYIEAQRIELKMIFDKSSGTIEWLVNGATLFSVNKIGWPSIAKGVVTLFENSNPAKLVSPDGFHSGFGLFTVLDFADPNKQNSKEGLVKLVNTTNAYAQPRSWFDIKGLQTNRLWGQGAQIEVFSHKVSQYKGA